MNLNDILGKDAYWVLNKRITANFGIEAAVLLADLLSKREYFKIKGQILEGGWFYNTRQNIENDTTLSAHKQRSALILLGGEFPIVETQEMGMPSKVHYRIIDDQLLKFFTTSSEEIEQHVVKNLHTNNNKYNNKEKDIVGGKATPHDEVFILDEELKKMEAVPGSHLDHIASYIRFKIETNKKLPVISRQNLAAMIKRHCKPASELSKGGYTVEQVHEKMKFLQNKYEHEFKTKGELNAVNWTLETVLKELTK